MNDVSKEKYVYDGSIIIDGKVFSGSYGAAGE